MDKDVTIVAIPQTIDILPEPDCRLLAAWYRQHFLGRIDVDGIVNPAPYPNFAAKT